MTDYHNIIELSYIGFMRGSFMPNDMIQTILGGYIVGFLPTDDGGVIYQDDTGSICYCNKNAKLSRVDGPAVIKSNGQKIYFLNGLLHRVNGPAIEDPHGSFAWAQHGKLHREDGPAIHFADIDLWYRNGQCHRDGGPAVIMKDHCSIWYQNGQRHRDGAPAVEWANGNTEWYCHGKLHRDGGPAKIIDGTEKWYRHGRLHRKDGPAVTRPNGIQEWWVNDKFVDIRRPSVN